MTSDRLASIQILRGVAAVLVLLVHAINVTDTLTPRLGPAFIGHLLALNEFGACGVDLFFVISGFVMCFALERADGINGAIAFLRQRWLRVVPPFWVACAIYLVVQLISPEPARPVSFFSALTLLPQTIGGHYAPPPLNVGWTLEFELTFYLLVAVTVMAIARPARTGALVTILAAATAAGIVLPSENVLFNPLLAEFALGIMVYRTWQRGWIAHDPWLPIAFGLAVLATTLVFGWPFSPTFRAAVAGYGMIWRVLTWGLPWALVLLGTLHLPIRSGRWSAQWMSIGDASYCLYLCHIPVCTIVLALAWSGPSWMPPSLLVLLIVPISLMLSLWLHRHVEQPYLRRLKRRKVKPLLDSETAKASV